MKLKTILPQILFSIILAFLSYTLTNKILNIESFQLNIYKTGLFDNNITNIVSYLAIAFEAIAILLLLFNKKSGLIYTIAMLFVFTLYISILKSMNKYEVCGCGGVLNGLDYAYHLIINGLLMISTIFLLLTENKQQEQSI